MLRAGLWADAESMDFWIQGFTESVDWEKVYQLAEEQSVIGVVLAGIENYNIKPPQELLLQWIGEVQMLEQQYKAMNQFIAELIEKLRREASDLRINGNLKILAKTIIENGNYDQIILYSSFVHVSWKRTGSNRLQILRKVGNGYQPVSRKEVLVL